MQRLLQTGGQLALSNGEIVHYQIKRDGQCDPEESNQVKTLLIVGLEKDANYHIKLNISFGHSKQFLGEGLIRNWGVVELEEYKCLPSCRVRYKTFKTDKWSEGFDLAEQYLFSEIETLNALVVERQQALIDAEME